jgi:hypothetical protein
MRSGKLVITNIYICTIIHNRSWPRECGALLYAQSTPIFVRILVSNLQYMNSSHRESYSYCSLMWLFQSSRIPTATGRTPHQKSPIFLLCTAFAARESRKLRGCMRRGGMSRGWKGCRRALSGSRDARADGLPSRSTRTWTKCSIVESGVMAGVADVMQRSGCWGNLSSSTFQRGVCVGQEWEVRMSGAGEGVSERDGPYTGGWSLWPSSP